MSFSFGSNNNNTSATTNNWGASTGFGRRASVGGPLSSSTTAAPNTNQLLFGNTASKPGGLFGNLNNTTAASTAGSGSGGLLEILQLAILVYLEIPQLQLIIILVLQVLVVQVYLVIQILQILVVQVYLAVQILPPALEIQVYLEIVKQVLLLQAHQQVYLAQNQPLLLEDFWKFFKSRKHWIIWWIYIHSTTTTTTTNIWWSFGGSSNSGGLFGAQQNQAPSLQLTVNNSNPYSYSQVLSNLQASSANMPESVTTSVFPDMMKGSNEKKRRFSYLEKPETHKPKSSLLSKLGQTFRLIRNGNAAASFESLKGLFTSNDELKPQQKELCYLLQLHHHHHLIALL